MASALTNVAGNKWTSPTISVRPGRPKSTSNRGDSIRTRKIESNCSSESTDEENNKEELNPVPLHTLIRDSLVLRSKAPKKCTSSTAIIRARQTRGRQVNQVSIKQKKSKSADKVADKASSQSSEKHCFTSKQISEIHGFLSSKKTIGIAKETNYTVRELYILFCRFKALCGISSTPFGIDKETFRRGVPMLSVEDNLFVDRVFEVLDEDGSGVIDWDEFLEAMSALEKGSREKRTEFLFRVYDIDNDGGITKDELCRFFVSSLMVEIDDNIQEVSEYFVNQVFSEVDANKDGSMTSEEALNYIARHPEVTDIYGLFGRSMMTGQEQSIRSDFLVHGPKRKVSNESI